MNTYEEMVQCASEVILAFSPETSKEEIEEVARKTYEEIRGMEKKKRLVDEKRVISEEL